MKSTILGCSREEKNVLTWVHCPMAPHM
jgi:hypothetical protein